MKRKFEIHEINDSEINDKVSRKVKILSQALQECLNLNNATFFEGLSALSTVFIWVAKDNMNLGERKRLGEMIKRMLERD